MTFDNQASDRFDWTITYTGLFLKLLQNRVLDLHMVYSTFLKQPLVVVEE